MSPGPLCVRARAYACLGDALDGCVGVFGRRPRWVRGRGQFYGTRRWAFEAVTAALKAALGDVTVAIEDPQQVRDVTRKAGTGVYSKGRD